MTTDFRALCAELLAWAEHTSAHYYQPPEVLIRARAALAEPEPEGPTDDELNKLMDSVLWKGSPNRWGLQVARAVLARWGHQPAPPAEGEVAELVRWLRSRAGIPASPDFPAAAVMLNRAADLLEQRHPEPVPVSERLPGPEMCWWWIEPDEDDDDSGYGGSWTLLRIRGNTVSYTHWLPAHALPLPAGEVSLD